MADLFENIDESAEELILRNAVNGKVFYTVSQSAKLLGLSAYQIRYAIDSFRLDAFLMFGEYRIPFNAILCYICDDLRSDYLRYYLCINELALSGVYALNFEGRIDPVVSSLKDRHMPEEAVLGLMMKDHRYRYDDMPSDDPLMMDWYSIEELDLPMDACLYEYAEMLDVKAALLARELGVSACDRISYPVLYDWLVEHELVNLPIPYSMAYQEDESCDAWQLLLGL